MPQLLFFTAIGAAALLGMRAFMREAERVTARARRKQQELRNGATGTLVQDPATGDYRLAKD